MAAPERVSVDTNVFLRYLTNDVPEQADAVERLLRRAGAGEIVLVTGILVIAEIVWTLESFYRLSRVDIQAKVRAIINTPGLEVHDRIVVSQAISDYVDKNVDFGDAYNATWMLTQGIRTVQTFDRRHFSRFERLEVREPGGS
ncbi:MAG: type II toxin-antitoxin system VapC family toxin [Gemmatimonadota bacterium]|nr:type II toxin-antitoxin system VapC family toxin [Gemmatimonadota bacterium]